MGHYIGARFILHFPEKIPRLVSEVRAEERPQSSQRPAGKSELPSQNCP